MIDFLRQAGWEIEYIPEKGWNSKPDIEILRYATGNQQGVLTQDIDFGELIFREREKFYALVRFWPGHFQSRIVIEHLNFLLTTDFDMVPPFILTVHIPSSERANIGVRIRQF